MSERQWSIRFRSATSADVPLLRLWDREPHVIAALHDRPSDDASGGSPEPEPPDHVSSEWDWPEALEIGRVHGPDVWQNLIAELDSGDGDWRPLGTVQIIDPYRDPTRYWHPVEPNQRAIDIWIGRAGDLARGYGTEMMSQVIDRIFADPSVEAILIDPLMSNTDAIRFYQRLGFEPVGERYFDEDRCFVHRLTRSRWQT